MSGLLGFAIFEKCFDQKAKDRVNKHYGGQGCETYHDFRKMLSRKDIDAVAVVTPDTGTHS